MQASPSSTLDDDGYSDDYNKETQKRKKNVITDSSQRTTKIAKTLPSASMNMVFPMEPALPEVHEEDRQLVRDVLYVAKAIQLSQSSTIFSSWQVQVRPDGYLVVLFLQPGFTLSMGDLQTFRDTNVLRVQSIYITGGGDASEQEKTQLKIKIINHKQPIMITEAEVVRVVRKNRGWFPFCD